jgi:hypothetical protein
MTKNEMKIEVREMLENIDNSARTAGEAWWLGDAKAKELATRGGDAWEIIQAFAEVAQEFKSDGRLFS